MYLFKTSDKGKTNFSFNCRVSWHLFSPSLWQMSEHFNQDINLTGKIPSGLFNAMFEFSGFWQKDAANTKTLAFDGVFITLYTVALEKSQMVLIDHVMKAVPSSWDPSALARWDRFYLILFLMKQCHCCCSDANLTLESFLSLNASVRFLDYSGGSLLCKRHKKWSNRIEP